jgi:hypothetical protein
MCGANKWQESYIRDTGFNPLTKFIASGQYRNAKLRKECEVEADAKVVKK